MPPLPSEKPEEKHLRYKEFHTYVPFSRLLSYLSLASQPSEGHWPIVLTCLLDFYPNFPFVSHEIKLKLRSISFLPYSILFLERTTHLLLFVLPI